MRAMNGDCPLEGVVNGASLDPRARAISMHVEVDRVPAKSESLANPLQLNMAELQAGALAV